MEALNRPRNDVYSVSSHKKEFTSQSGGGGGLNRKPEFQSLNFAG